MLKCFLAVLKDLRDLQVGGGPLVGDRCFKVLNNLERRIS